MALPSPPATTSPPSPGTWSSFPCHFLSQLKLQAGALISLYAPPHLPRTLQPTTLVFGITYSTTVILLLLADTRSYTYTFHLLALGLVASCIVGAVCAVDAIDFVFRYLQFGCVAALGASLMLRRAGIGVPEGRGDEKETVPLLDGV